MPLPLHILLAQKHILPAAGRPLLLADAHGKLAMLCTHHLTCHVIRRLSMIPGLACNQRRIFRSQMRRQTWRILHKLLSCCLKGANESCLFCCAATAPPCPPAAQDYTLKPLSSLEERIAALLRLERCTQQHSGGYQQAVCHYWPTRMH